MSKIIIRQAMPEDVADLSRALAQLSADMGDQHRASDTDIARFCFGPSPVCHALLAQAAEGGIVGVAAYSPFLSTTYGGVGIYVSDLWVAEEMRGRQLGLRLLVAVQAFGLKAWDARLMRLNVYKDNSRALAFYERIGFVHSTAARFMTLAGKEFELLGEKA